MTITATQLKEIKQEFTRLKPATVTLDGKRTMSVKEAVFALAPTLELFGSLALHKVEMQRSDFRLTQKLLIACHEPFHFFNCASSSSFSSWLCFL